MTEPERRLELLLADADDGSPVLAEGLSTDTMRDAPRPDALPRRAAQNLQEAVDEDPNDLSFQRWGLVAPLGEEGDQLVAAVRELVRLREDEQGAPARVYRVPPGMDTTASLAWREQEYEAEDVPDRERPAYLLILGDLHQISVELQHVLAQCAYVGRVCFPDTNGYAAYAAKVRRWAERPAQVDTPNGLFFTVRDGTDATGEGYRLLMRPCLDHLASWRVPVTGPLEIPFAGAGIPGALIEAAAAETAAVLLSLSHGAGPPSRGWKSPEEQRARQGAMVLGGGVRLDAGALRGGRFLPGGMWLYVACLGAGTPSTSAFHPWLSRLAAQGVVTCSSSRRR